MTTFLLKIISNTNTIPNTIHFIEAHSRKHRTYEIVVRTITKSIGHNQHMIILDKKQRGKNPLIILPLYKVPKEKP